jgi:hypothetical protein
MFRKEEFTLFCFFGTESQFKNTNTGITGRSLANSNICVPRVRFEQAGAGVQNLTRCDNTDLQAEELPELCSPSSHENGIYGIV